MKTMTKLNIVILLIGILFILSACQRIWYFKISDVTDPRYPQFKVSRSKIFTNLGVGFSIFDIDEVNERNDTIKHMWAIQPVENYDINDVVYGIVPKGFRELSPAVPLELGKLYRVHGSYFFRLIEKNGKVYPEVYSHSKFYEKFEHSTFTEDRGKPEKAKNQE